MPEPMNLAVVRGAAGGPPELRQLPSGRRCASFSLRTVAQEPPSPSVPVLVWDPPPWIETVDDGDELVVAGPVRRRFYRSATGGVAARVELEATVVGRSGDPRKERRVREALTAAVASLPAEARR